MMQATETRNETPVATEEVCGNCGGSLEDGFEEQHHGTDPETGYADVWLICGACAEKESSDYDEATETMYDVMDDAAAADREGF